MHPIERLRYIARTEGEPAAALATEAVYTLADLAQYEPNAVLTAARRLLDRHPECGPLWWAASHLVGGGDLTGIAQSVAAELLGDSTPERLVAAMRTDFTSGSVLVLGMPCDTAPAVLPRLRHSHARLVGESWELHRAIRQLGHAGLADVVGYMTGDEEEALAGAAVVLVEALAVGPAGCVLSAESACLVEAARGTSVPVWLVSGVGRALSKVMFEGVVSRLAAVGSHSDVVSLEGFSTAVGPDGTCAPAALASGIPDRLGSELLRRPI